MPAELGTGQFVQETLRGVEAFLASVSVMRSEPERAVALAAVDVAGAAKLFDWRGVSRVVEPAVLPLIGGAVLRSRKPLGQRLENAAALAGGAVAQWGKSAGPDKGSALATAGVITQYGAYAATLAGDLGAKPKFTGAAVRGALLASGAAVAAAKNRKLVAPTLLGGAAMVYATEVANDPKIRAHGTGHTPGISHGANLLVASEALTLVRGTFLQGKRGFGARSVEAGALVLSSLGHLLLTDGLARR